MITEFWQWPQWTYLALIVFNLLVAASSHGKPRGPHNGWESLAAIAVVLFITIEGGFWTPGPHR